jgi:class 3 adenylate cyclase/tetratricopeptide (TPR) repeat protein
MKRVCDNVTIPYLLLSRPGNIQFSTYSVRRARVTLPDESGCLTVHPQLKSFMVCPQCRSENSPNSVFCDECGARLELVCPHCEEPNRTGAKFCRNCGQLINQTPPTAPSVVPGVPSPHTYVPKYLAEKILAARHTLEGERKQVTVLFADIRGSTRLVEGLDPEDAQRVIDPVLNVMMEAVHRYEGTVNQVLGDGIMALFGAPVAHEDHALRACYAALAMQEGMRRHRQSLGQSDELGLQIGIGLNSGEVVLRSIDSDLNIDYSAPGLTTHLAARMQEIAGRGSILMTASTLRQVEGFVEVKSLGAVQAKGISHLVDAYELTGATTARTRLHAAVARGLTPFVGRKTEIETLQELMGKSAAGRGQIFSMVGEPGMGKSRLVYEFIHFHVSPDWRVLEAPAVSYGKATPYFPVIELLRRYFEISEGEGAESIRGKVIDHVLKLDEMLTDAIPPILLLLGILPDHKVDPSLSQSGSSGHQRSLLDAIKRFGDMESQQRRRYALEALKRLMIRESQRQKLILVFEDLHWIDNETQAFLDNLVESLPVTQMLLLVNYRPGYSHNWADKTYYTQLRVDPLPSTGAEELLQHLLGSNPDLGPLKEFLIKRTEGNPFFVEESVRSLVETGILAGEKRAYRPGLRIDSIAIPSTVQSVLADRIDRLPIEEKHLLQVIATIGVIVPFRLLRTVAELPDDELYGYLAKLQSAEFIYEVNLFPELEYSFKHALINEVAYGALLRERRTQLHARIVSALEEVAGDNLYDHVEALAHHAFRGELWDKAVAYLRQAGAKAMSHSALVEALASYGQALEAVEYVRDSQEKLKMQIDLHLDSRNVLFLMGDSPRVAQHLHQAESLAETLGDQQRLARVLNFLNSYYGLAGDPERAIQIGQRTLALAGIREDRALNVVTHYYLGAAYNKTGQYNEAIEVLQHGMRSIGGELRYERFGTTVVLSVICRSHLVQCLAATGRFSEGLRIGEEGVRIGEEVNHAASLVHMSCSLGVLFLFRGEFEKAIAILEGSLRISHSANVPVYVPYAASRLGAAYAHSGRVSEAMRYLEDGVENLAAAGRVAFLSLSTVWLSEGYLLCGRLDKASEVAHRALDLSRKHKERGHEAWALKMLGDIALHSKPPQAEQAEVYYRQALALSDALGMQPLRAHCKLGLGNVHASRGIWERAGAELAAAAELYRSMEMNFWLSRGEAALRDMAM